MDTLDGKVTVVTGGADGVGFGLAQAFAEEGARLVLADIDTEQLDLAVGTLADRGVEVLGVPTDVSDARAVAHLRDATYERFGTAHVLCNNAGIGGNCSLLEPLDLAMWERVFAVDYWSVLHGIDAFLPRMLEQGEGHIVNTSSRQGLIASSGLGPYPSAKYAVVALTEMLHQELAAIDSPVGTTVLTPGGVLTKLIVTARARFAQGEEMDDATRRWLDTRVATAVEPIEVGRLAVRAVTSNALYVNTHHETLDWLQQRVDRIAADAAALGTLR